MITYVNSKDAKLFELAAEKLGVQKGELELDQYLDRLGELKEEPKFVRLPLYEEGHEDEEIFVINANERTIKIPSSFSKNGIGVVSDEMAEILWFKINRYFDIKDFGKAVGKDISTNLKDGDLHILIQWEAPDGTKGASWAIFIDADTDPDYIYFGWGITADHLTAKVGNIKFAVRILQYEQDGISYSFSTQAAAVAVKGNLSFDLTDEGVVFENVTDKVVSRLMGGQVAHCPVFEEGGDLPAYIIDLVPPAEGEPAQATLRVTAAAPNDRVKDPEDPDKMIEVPGSYDAMAYKWFKKGANDEDFAQIEGEYSPALTVTSSGQYYVIIYGMREIVDDTEYVYIDGAVSETPEKFRYHSSIASTKSTVCEIPAPIKLEIQPFVDPEDATKILGYMARKFVIGKDGQLEILVNRQKIGEAVVGDVELRFEKTASAEKDLDLETAEFLPVDLSSTPGKEAVAEAWIWNEVEYATEEEAIAAKGEEEGEIVHREAEEAVPAVEAPITYEVNEAGEIAIDMANAEEGYYKVYVVNKLNGDEEITLAFNKKPEGGVELVENATCRVVKPAEILPYNPEAEGDYTRAILLTRSGNESTRQEGSVRDGNKIKAHCAILGLSDEVEIKWYEVAGEQDPEDPRELEDELIEGATGDEFVPDHQGTYYFIAVNKVEDTISEEVRSNAIVFTL